MITYDQFKMGIACCGAVLWVSFIGWVFYRLATPFKPHQPVRPWTPEELEQLESAKQVGAGVVMGAFMGLSVVVAARELLRGNLSLAARAVAGGHALFKNSLAESSKQSPKQPHITSDEIRRGKYRKS